jgi:flagellar biosynthetic protein FlhB
MPEEPAGERTEAATPRKREQARRKGQVAKSQDVNSTITLIASLIALYLLGQRAVGELYGVFRYHLATACETQLTSSTFGAFALGALIPLAKIILPFMLVALVAGVLANVMQVGFLFSGEQMVPDLTKLNPFAGFSKFVSISSVVDLVKAALKLGIVGWIAYATIRAAVPSLLLLPASAPGPIVLEILMLCFRLAMRAVLAMIFLAILDYGFQRWKFERSIKMTRQEVREELRHLEGDPLIRARIRSIRRQMSLQRMMTDVPTADVVVTNPYHIAVALRYDMTRMRAPKVVAKGARLLAERIKQIAAENRVPVVEKRTLAQLLYKSVEVGQEIPENLYQVVAEVLAYVYQIDQRAEKVSERVVVAV